MPCRSTQSQSRRANTSRRPTNRRPALRERNSWMQPLGEAMKSMRSLRSVTLAEISRQHAGIDAHLGGTTVCNLLAVVEHDNVIGEIHHHADVMLDQHDGHAEL